MGEPQAEAGANNKQSESDSVNSTIINIGDNHSAKSSSVSNTLKSNQKLKQVKHKKPLIQRNPSHNFNSTNSNANSTTKYIYSVDDDAEEIEKDLEREYLEGYNDAVKQRYKLAKNNITSPDIQNLSNEVLANLLMAQSNLKKLEDKEGDFCDEDHISNNQLSPVLAHTDPHFHPNNVHHIDYYPSTSHSSHKNEPELHHHHHHLHQAESAEDNGDGEGENGQNEDSSSVNSMESFTLRERQDAINTTHPFGIRIWKPALYKKIRSVQREADLDIHDTTDLNNNKKYISLGVYITNVLWSMTLGLLLFLVCFIGSVFLLVFGFKFVHYSKVFFNLGIYLLWPFGKVVYLQRDENYLNEDSNEGTTIGEYRRWRDEEQTKLFFNPSNTLPNTHQVEQRSQPIAPIPSQQQVQPQQSNQHSQDDEDFRKQRFFGRGDWNLSRILFYLYFYLVLTPIFGIVWLFCWLFVFTIPMAKLITTLSDHLRRHPLAIFFKFDSTPLPSDRMKNSNILLCTYRCSGWHYYKYTVEGTNIFVINLIFIVIFTILDFFVLKDLLNFNNLITNDSVIFTMCLLSIIPLAYFIGQAVASISAQSSMGLSAVINAFFSTVVEVFLYCIALNQKKAGLVEGSMIGSILGAVLLLPGLSMCAGAFIRKTQRYNPASAGVSSTMLLFSIAVLFVPTIFHQIYGSYEIKCTKCTEIVGSLVKDTCQKCHFIQPPLEMDNLFKKYLMPFSIICALILFFAYIIGLWFTLRTHAALIWQTPITDKQTELQQSQEQQAVSAGGGHEAPNWSKQKSTCVLLGATLLYAIIAEILVDCVDSVLKNFPIDPKFMGITIFALVPNTTEFLNAISFATYGNIALSMEIGTAYALQVCLIQIPALVLYSIFFIDWNDPGLRIHDSMFTLIFPKWDLFASVMAVILFTYIYAEGKSNYFKGSILILLYIILIIGFYFSAEIESTEMFISGLMG